MSDKVVYLEPADGNTSVTVQRTTGIRKRGKGERRGFNEHKIVLSWSDSSAINQRTFTYDMIENALIGRTVSRGDTVSDEDFQYPNWQDDPSDDEFEEEWEETEEPEIKVVEVEPEKEITVDEDTEIRICGVDITSPADGEIVIESISPRSRGVISRLFG